MGFKFRLCLESGEDIGRFETGVPNWELGDELFNVDHHWFHDQIDNGNANDLTRAR